MKRIITSSTNDKINDTAIYKLLGKCQYDQLYKQCVFLTDSEICNTYGNVDVKYSNGGNTGILNLDNTITITSKIYSEFQLRNFNHSVYTELECTYDGIIINSPIIVYFKDNYA